MKTRALQFFSAIIFLAVFIGCDSRKFDNSNGGGFQSPNGRNTEIEQRASEAAPTGSMGRDAVNSLPFSPGLREIEEQEQAPKTRTGGATPSGVPSQIGGGATEPGGPRVGESADMTRQLKRRVEHGLRAFLAAQSRYRGDQKSSEVSFLKFPFELLLFQHSGMPFAPRPKFEDPYLKDEMLRTAGDARDAINDYLPVSNPDERAQLKKWIENLGVLIGPEGIPDPGQGVPKRPQMLPGVNATPAEMWDYLKRHRR